ncbi:MAG: hypothetical protein ALECFALPRED_006685 [Alectoria fallacina]|uniref:Uncharacterized protein n=1 Tax=Alectoria fallacina TaxID=1903189 RepID=A0A8H3EUF2_9LECA|nr:MAG: hypothetical protein ALECFALPRED_006685 [Alectoria fallacina]
MAYSPSPHIASLAVASSSSRFNRHSPSPPLHQPLSKRDKKRNVMENRLAEISSSFAENRDHLYRKQLQALQADMNYIQAAHLYDNAPLDEIGDDGMEEANTSAAASTAGSLRNAHQAHLNGHTRLEVPYKTGPQTAEFIQEINDAMEQRDADLTTVVYRHNFRIREVQKDNMYNVEVALKEHRLLTENLRQRLIHSVNQKRSALLKEKEKLDIADTNALLFHPNQFSINNSASPGGTQSNRKTRHARHRLEIEELEHVSGVNNKRKRRPPTDIENGSPGPAGRDIEPTNPLKEANARLEAHQVTAPLYSIDRLFSTRELDMNLQQACYDVIAEQGAKRRRINADSQINGASIDSFAHAMSESDDGFPQPEYGVDGEAEDFVAAAATMERTNTQTSTQYHTTRSTRKTNPSNSHSAREQLGELAGREAAIPSIGTYQKEKKREEEYQRAPPLSELDAESDMALYEAAMKDDDATRAANEKLLEEVVEELEDHVGTPFEEDIDSFYRADLEVEVA